VDKFKSITFMVLSFRLYFLHSSPGSHPGRQAGKKIYAFNYAAEITESFGGCSYHCSQCLDQFTGKLSLLGCLDRIVARVVKKIFFHQMKSHRIMTAEVSSIEE
jgi:hypothetical protein